MKTIKTIKIIKRIFLVMSAVLITGLAVSCAEPSETAIVSVNQASLIETKTPGSEADITAAKGANDFAFRLSAALSKTEMLQNGAEANFICSPFSVYLSLAALSNAVGGDEKSALLESLGAYGISENDVNTAASRMLYDLTSAPYVIESSENNFTPLHIANAVFADKNKTLNKDFAQIFADYYRGAAFGVDFSGKESADAVNRWASENTNGLIDKIIDDFDPNTIAAIASAIYFSDRWSSEFDKSDTKTDTFLAPGGATVTTEFMLRSGRQNYYEDDAVQSTFLNFKNGGGMYVLLPKKESAADLLQGMDYDFLSVLRDNMERRDGVLKLPKFEIESGVMNLNDALISLGIPLFDSGNPAITGIVDGEPLYISSAVQKAVIKVDEAGTTAAAVTVEIMAGNALEEPTVPFEMICDKPFVFVLCGGTKDGGQKVLFTGAVNKP